MKIKNKKTIIYLIIVIIIITNVSATETGYTPPGDITDLTGTGTETWSNPENAETSDNSYARGEISCQASVS